MKVVADTNTFLAVALNEPEKAGLIALTDGHDLVAPAVLPYEIGNALSSLFRRKVLKDTELEAAWDAASAVPVELRAVDGKSALKLVGRFGIYAYDAYFLQCSLDAQAPLLTLDAGMKRVAADLGIDVWEVR